MIEMTTTTTTTVETIRGRHGAVSTWAVITDGKFVRGGLNIKTGGIDNYLRIKGLGHLLDIIAAAHELRVAIAEKVTDASTEAA